MEQKYLDEMTSGILNIFQDRLMAVILYGSVARGNNRDDSDVDIAMIITDTLSSEDDDRLSELVAEMNLKYDKVFSVVDINADNFEKWKTVSPFYKNVSTEGVVLWKAA